MDNNRNIERALRVIWRLSELHTKAAYLSILIQCGMDYGGEWKKLSIGLASAGEWAEILHDLENIVRQEKSLEEFIPRRTTSDLSGPTPEVASTGPCEAPDMEIY